MQLRGEKLQYSQEYTGDLNSSMCLLVFSRVVGISIDKKTIYVARLYLYSLYIHPTYT
jgi:hypothetical protein